MGVCECKGINQDKYSSDFTQEFKIRLFPDKSYITYLESKSIFKDKEVIIRELLKIQKVLFIDEQQRFLGNISSFPIHYIYISLLFLTSSTHETFASSYKLLFEKLQIKFYEEKKTTLEDFSLDSHIILREVLKIYFRIISLEIIKATLQVEKIKKEAKLNYKELSNNYGAEFSSNLRKLIYEYNSEVIDELVNEFFRDLNINPLNIDQFFNKNFHDLNDSNVRMKLTTIFQTGLYGNYSDKLGDDYDIYNENSDKLYIVAAGNNKNMYNLPSPTRKAFTLLSSSKPTQVINPILIQNSQNNSMEKKELIYLNNDLNKNNIKNEAYSKTPEIILDYDNNYISKNNNSLELNFNISTNPYLNTTQRSSLIQEDKFYHYGPAFGTIYNEVLNKNLNLNAENNDFKMPFLSKPSINTRIKKTASILGKTKFFNTRVDEIVKLSSNIKSLKSESFAPLNIDRTKFNLVTFKKTFLEFHNKVRKIHQAGELVEDQHLSDNSQIHANLLARCDKLSNSGKKLKDKILGENIAKVSGNTNTEVDFILKNWYDQKENIDFNFPKYKIETSNFTQMIWRESKQIGMGIAFSNTGNAYVVLNYFPEGNLPEGFLMNIKSGIL